ncbi:MAG TPA: hypothetical protein VHT31_06665, partial [Candidatus Acidoferrum sp.]|nr:hypothetical protein [Candidatus Acidoferrum sp.]
NYASAAPSAPIQLAGFCWIAFTTLGGKFRIRVINVATVQNCESVYEDDCAAIPVLRIPCFAIQKTSATE